MDHPKHVLSRQDNIRTSANSVSLWRMYETFVKTMVLTIRYSHETDVTILQYR